MLFDMDNATHFNALGDSITITTGDGYIIASNTDGLNNSGTSVVTNNFAQTRTANLLGQGTIYFPNNNITRYVINSDVTSSGNNNDGGITFNIECNIRADYQGLVKIGGVSRVYHYGTFISGVSEVTVDTSLKAFLLLGGQLRVFRDAQFQFSGARTDGFVFTPTGGFTPALISQSTTIISPTTITNLFNKTNNNDAQLVFVNSDSSVLLSVVNIFESTNLWDTIRFTNNIFETGSIDATKADLTQTNTKSSINTIGNNIIETEHI